jgi:WD40 repeat protein
MKWNGKLGAIFPALILCLGIAGCGAGNANSPPPIVSITVSPSAVTVSSTGTQSFTATVTGTNNTGVTWSVQEGVTGGSITSAGAYTAPQAAGTYHVVATSQADNTKSATATVTVTPPPVVVSVFPMEDTLGFGGLRDFHARVTGSSDTAVTWSVQEGVAGGTITPDGLYTAPNTAGTFHVVVTSVADPNRGATATVTVVQSGFLPVGQMASRRNGHTATLLSDGRVLIVGGFDTFTDDLSAAITPLATAEIFDPAAGSFTATGNMQTARAFHTATLLPNNKVLVAGGADNNSAELFDPTTGTFAKTGDMGTGRIEHTAMLLSDGTVLLAGGFDSRASLNVLATAELFDPNTGDFTPTVSMQTPREFHTATLLADGQVLVAGGFVDTSGSAVESAELYDPSTRSFSRTGSLVSPRGEFTATLLPNGKVLVAGGVHVFFDGGVLTTILYASAQVYHPATESFVLTESMQEARYLHAAVALPNSTVLVSGGHRSFFSTHATVELFDPANGTFSLTGSLATDRLLHTATVLANGKVLVVGGIDKSGNVLASAELYAP